ncbi:MAG TPA: amino acid adenylation domain-containing protein, partial [Pseudobacteroides sp.]|uniref:non-ribosomal peptide synthetase n=1 Tax=Pseudobacteroides sp. TaxID=1968840 RepID=UPI002F94578C
ENLYETFPLTEVQMAYFMGRNSGLEMGGVSTHGYYEIETVMDMEKLNKGLVKAIERQHMLRAIIMPNGEQKILEEVPEYKINIRDIRNMSKDEQQEEILKERERMSHYVFKTDEWPLFEFKALQLSDETHYLFVGFDLLISDGTSTRILIKEILDYYNNPGIEAPELEFSFRDYVKAYEELKKSEMYEKDKAYWLEKLGDFPASPALPLKTDPSNVSQPHFKRCSKVFEKSEWDLIKRKAQEKSITPSALLCTAFAKVLAFWSNQPHLAVNLTVFNRYPFHKDVNSIIGDFTSVMLLDVNLKPDMAFWDSASAIQDTLMEALEHRHYDGIEFIREISKYNNMGTKAVMPIVFTSMLFSMDKDEKSVDLGDLGEIKMGVSQTSQVYLDYQAWENKGELLITWDYVEELFDKEVIESMFKQYRELLEVIPENKEISLRSEDKDIMLMKEYNNTREEITPTTLTRLFNEQVKRVPYKEAVRFQDESISYAELDRKSNQVAHYLRECGVGRNDLVGVLAARRIETIVNLMGILKAGGAYVPVDPDYPEDRRNYILENSCCKLMITPELYIEKEIRNYPHEEIKKGENPEDLAYIIYTSGSTGRPKGVVITHGAVTNTIIDINQKFSVDEKDRIIGLSSMCFDLSVYDIFGALSSGATLVMVPDVRDIRNIIGVVKKENITLWNSVPAIMDMLIENMESAEEDITYWQAGYNSGMSVQYDLNDSLKVVMLSGDWIPLGLPDKVRDKFPMADVISLGGATEASIWSIYYPINDIKNEWKSIPYGIPLANQEFYVLNYEMECCPVGVQGELFIGGVGLAKGYMNDEEKTKNAFMVHPQYGNLYKTGDYGVMHKEGYIEFLGRKDHQVKIRGHRIELGEIESSLLRHESVRNAVVVDLKDKNGKKYLCAYIVSEEKLNIQDLKNHVSVELPEYMVPSYFVHINEVPLTPNGKVNRKALPEPDTSCSGGGSQYIVPTSTVEIKLAEICQVLADKDRISVNENFFDLGLDSIKVITLVARIQSEFGIKVPFEVVFRRPTIRLIAEYIQKENDGKEAVCVLLNSERNKNIFAFPPILTMGFVYRALSQSINSHSFYAMDFVDREDIISYYADEIAKIQGNNEPIVLAGHSAGGNIAVEVAKGLFEKGYQVSDIILLDSYYINDSMKGYVMPPHKEEYIKNLLEHMASMYPDKVGIREQFDRYMTERIIKYFDVLDTLTISERIPSRIHFISSTGDLEYKAFLRTDMCKWSEATSIGFQKYQGFGTHDEMLYGEYALKNAKLVEAILKDC